MWSNYTEFSGWGKGKWGGFKDEVFRCKRRKDLKGLKRESLSAITIVIVDLFIIRSCLSQAVDHHALGFGGVGCEFLGGVF